MIDDLFNTPPRQPQEDDGRVSASSTEAPDVASIRVAKIEWNDTVGRKPTHNRGTMGYITRLNPWVPRTGRILNNPPTFQ